VQAAGGGRAPPPLRTEWTRRVPPPVLIGHAASLRLRVEQMRALDVMVLEFFAQEASAPRVPCPRAPRSPAPCSGSGPLSAATGAQVEAACAAALCDSLGAD